MRAPVLTTLLLAACVPLAGTPTTPTGTTLTTNTPTVVGTGPVEDRIVQDRSPEVDVLFVVQDDAGMADLQDALADNNPFLFDYFLGSGLDYHVGVVTTDPADGGVLVGGGWIEADTPNPVNTLAGWTTVGETGSTPQPLGATWLALEVERDLANAGFYRDTAALRVIVVGDGADATDPAIVDPATFPAWFDGLKADPEQATFSCLVDGAGTACADVAAAVGGEVVDASDPAEALETIGLHAAGFTRSFPLSQLPVTGTIQVMVETPDGVHLMFQEAVDWTYDAVDNAITFVEFVPDLSSTVVITYDPA